MDSLRLATRSAEVIHAKRGEDIVILDLRAFANFADFFVVSTATSTVHARALAEEVERQLAKLGVKPHHIEGSEHGQWILLDYFDVVVHIFLGDVREFYGLERLWGDVPQRAVTSQPGRR